MPTVLTPSFADLLAQARGFEPERRWSRGWTTAKFRNGMFRTVIFGSIVAAGHVDARMIVPPHVFGEVVCATGVELPKRAVIPPVEFTAPRHRFDDR